MDYSHRPFPNRLRIIRENAGYQQKQVATLLGLAHPVSLSEWENEKTMPSGTNLIKLCVLYRKSVTELYPEYAEVVARELLNHWGIPEGYCPNHIDQYRS